VIVGYAAGEARELPLRPTFDRRIKLEFHGARITSDGGLLAYRELDAVLGLTEIAIMELLDSRRGKNARHTLAGAVSAVGIRAARRLRGCQRRRAARLRPRDAGDRRP
jgi:hypothetical protein